MSRLEGFQNIYDPYIWPFIQWKSLVVLNFDLLLKISINILCSVARAKVFWLFKKAWFSGARIQLNIVEVAAVL